MYQLTKSDGYDMDAIKLQPPTQKKPPKNKNMEGGKRKTLIISQYEDMRKKILSSSYLDVTDTVTFTK